MYKRTIDNKIDMGNDVVNAWVASFGQGCHSIAGVDHYMNPKAFKSEYEFCDRTRLVEWFPAQYCDAIMLVTICDDFFNNRRNGS